MNPLAILAVLAAASSASGPTHPGERFHFNFNSGTVPPGSTNNGLDPAYADPTYAAPLEGVYSLGGSGAVAHWYVPFTEIVGTAHGCFRYSTQMAASSNGVFSLYSGAPGSTSRLFRVRILSAGTIRLYGADGTTSLQTSGALVTANTLNYFRFEYTPGSGTDGSVKVYHSTDNVNWTLAIDYAALPATANASELRFECVVAGTVCVWDEVAVAETAYTEAY